MIAAISPSVQCVLAPNPSPMTAAGTNSYVIKGKDSAIVIDPGPDLSSHRAALLRAIDGVPLQAILITHAHIDHTEMVPWLAAQTGALVMSFGGAERGRDPDLAALCSGEGVDLAHRPDVVLSDGQPIWLAEHQITALHTPGHMKGHLCFAFEDVLFSGDHVMGWSSSVVAPPDGDMGDYRASLSKLLDRKWRQFLPGHGAVINAPARRIQELITHRAQRESMILAALSAQGANAESLTKAVYTDLAPHLFSAAMQNVLAHLIDLANRKHIAARAKVSISTIFDRI